MSIIIFTSGTTGMAKGIMLSHRNIAADLMVSPTLVDFLPSDIFFSVLPIHHTFEVQTALYNAALQGWSHCALRGT